MEFELSGENEANHQSGSNENTPLEQRSPPKPRATSTLTPLTGHNNHKIPKTRGYPTLPPRNVHKEDEFSTSQQYPRLSRHRAVAREHHHTIITEMQESRRVPDSRSHKNQKNDSQPLVNSSYPFDRFRS